MHLIQPPVIFFNFYHMKLHSWHLKRQIYMHIYDLIYICIKMKWNQLGFVNLICTMQFNLLLANTRKCPLRGHCLAPPGGPGDRKTRRGDSNFFKCIFFTLNTYQETFISDILRCDLKLYSVTYGRTYGRTDRREV